MHRPERLSLCAFVLGDKLCRANPILVRENRGICRKSVSDCVTKFDNIENFGGYTRKIEDKKHTPLPPRPSDKKIDHAAPDRQAIPLSAIEYAPDGETPAALHHFSIPGPARTGGKPARRSTDRFFAENESLCNGRHFRRMELYLDGYPEDVIENLPQYEYPRHIDFYDSVGWSFKSTKFNRRRIKLPHEEQK